MIHRHKESGFTAVELLVTLFVAAAFLIAGYQLFNLIIKDSGNVRSEARASNVAYDYLRTYTASSVQIPCSPSTPLDNADLAVDGLVNVKMTITITCPSTAFASLSKVDAEITYNAPAQTIKYSTYASPDATTRSTDVTNGLVAWWKLNGNPNTTDVASPNGVVTNATPTTHNGIANTAYNFNGTDSSIKTASNFGLGAVSTTISAWVYTSSASNAGMFVMVGSTGYGIGMGSTSTNNSAPGTKLVMIYENIRWIQTSADVGIGWHHVAMVINSLGTPLAYLDGVLVGSYAGTGANAPSDAAVYIGSGPSSTTRFFKGSIDDVRLYNRALSSSEILSLYTGGAK